MSVDVKGHRRTVIFCIIAALGSIMLAIPAFCGAPIDNAVVCFPESDAARLLRVVEKDLPDCQSGAIAADETIRAQEARIDELRGERDQCAEASKQAAKASEQAVDAAKGSWWDRLKSSAVKVGAGVLIGIVAALLL